MAKKTDIYNPIKAENNGLRLKGKYKKLRKGEYRLIMEEPTHFEREYKEDILEVEEMVDWIMKQEMIEIIDDYYEIKENTPILDKILSEYEDLIDDENLTDSEKQIILSNLYDQYIPEDKQSLHRLKTQYSPSEIRYFLSISL